MVAAHALYAANGSVGEMPGQQDRCGVEFFVAGLLIEREPEQILMEASEPVDLAGAEISSYGRFHAATWRRSTRVLGRRG